MGEEALPGGLGIPVLEGLCPALPQAVASLFTARQSVQPLVRVRGAWRLHRAQKLQVGLRALPVCMGRDSRQRSLMVPNRGLTQWTDCSGSCSLPSSWVCWGNGGPEQPRHQPKVTEARGRYERKPQRPNPKLELWGKCDICLFYRIFSSPSTAFSVLDSWREEGARGAPSGGLGVGESLGVLWAFSRCSSEVNSGEMAPVRPPEPLAVAVRRGLWE